MTGFFEHQRLARRNSRVMVLLFALAVVAVVAALDLVLAALYLWANDADMRVPGELVLGGAVATAAVILVVSLVSVARLGEGGVAVARMVGARRVASDTRDPLERRLANVVEEMALASGVRVPGVYVLDGEGGINAFAAGWDVSSAVVAVTRGTLESLTRDELQGVIGHEFSHILNGDMRLNIRMIGVLAGIVFIGSIGEFVMRSVRGSREGKGAAGFFLAGLAIFVIGYVGLVFARLIKSAVSRQREFLADASSVQFTRNPEGIAGALDQIRASQAGALISGRYAEELSHMFFGQSVRMRLGALFDTHPPLDERIGRVHPRFDSASYRKTRSTEAARGAAAAQAHRAQPAGRRAGDIGYAWGRSAAESVLLVGSLDAGKVDYAARLLAALPEPLRACLRDAEGARAAIIALMLAPRETVMADQLQAMQAAGLGELGERARAASALTQPLAPAFRLPVIDLALPAVKSAPSQAKQELLGALEVVIHADRRVSLHEFVVLSLLRHQLAPGGKGGGDANRKISRLKTEAATLLTLVKAASGHAEVSGAPTLEAAAAALEALKALAPLEKALLVEQLFAAVTADGTIRVGEAELLRLVGAVLDCPLPPLLDDLSALS